MRELPRGPARPTGARLVGRRGRSVLREVPAPMPPARAPRPNCRGRLECLHDLRRRPRRQRPSRSCGRVLKEGRAELARAWRSAQAQTAQLRADGCASSDLRQTSGGETPHSCPACRESAKTADAVARQLDERSGVPPRPRRRPRSGDHGTERQPIAPCDAGRREHAAVARSSPRARARLQGRGAASARTADVRTEAGHCPRTSGLAPRMHDHAWQDAKRGALPRARARSGASRARPRRAASCARGGATPRVVVVLLLLLVVVVVVVVALRARRSARRRARRPRSRRAAAPGEVAGRGHRQQHRGPRPPRARARCHPPRLRRRTSRAGHGEQCDHVEVALLGGAHERRAASPWRVRQVHVDARRAEHGRAHAAWPAAHAWTSAVRPARSTARFTSSARRARGERRGREGARTGRRGAAASRPSSPR